RQRARVAVRSQEKFESRASRRSRGDFPFSLGKRRLSQPGMVILFYPRPGQFSYFPRPLSTLFSGPPPRGRRFGVLTSLYGREVQSPLGEIVRCAQTTSECRHLQTLVLRRRTNESHRGRTDLRRSQQHLPILDRK